MNKTTQSADTIDVSRLSLEGGSNLHPAVFTDESILDDASRYNIDLDALENSGAQTGDVQILQQTPNMAEEPRRITFGQDIDVNLGDMINSILESSARIVVIVSDDKIVYLNKTAKEILEIGMSRQAIGDNFLSYVDKSDWNTLAENIGEMLTDGKRLNIRLKTANNKIFPIDFQAVYLPDTAHFSFILLSSHRLKEDKPLFNNLYDDLTGLPNFFLFEDRVQMAVNNENYKDVRLPKDMIAVAAISIDNIDVFRKLNLEDYVLKKLSTTLVLSMRKNYTVARGLKYQFWVLMPDIIDETNLEIELAKIKSVFQEGVTDNFNTHEVITSMGVTVFPDPARSAKKLIEQAIFAVKKAQEIKGNSLIMFDGRQ